MKVSSLLNRGCGLAVVLLAALWAGPVAAAECTSTSDGTWEQTGGTATWDCNGAGAFPSPGDSVTIADQIQILGNIEVGNLTIDSGAILLGYNPSDTTTQTLFVGGHWTNNGQFQPNRQVVEMNTAGTSGLPVQQNINGDTTFFRLLTSGGFSTKVFGNHNFRIIDRLQHNSGTMERGESSFTFEQGSSIRGSAPKQFFDLTINGSGVVHTSGDIYVSGSVTVNDGASLNFQVSGSAVREFRFDGTNQTFSIHGSGSVAFDKLVIASSAVVDFPSLNHNQPTAEEVVNNGILRQSGNTGTSAQFVFITDSDGPGPFAYQGLEIESTGADFNATVGIGGNRTNCTNPGGYDHRNRCFGVKNNDTTATTANVTLYTTADEDDITGDRFYEYSGGTTWTDRGVCPTGDGAPCTANGIVIEPGDNYFLIGTETPPTPVTLTGFTVTRAEDANHLAWETATEVNFAGFYVQRRTDEGHFARVSNFLYAQGGPLSGASYTWTDTDLANGPYQYRLEAVDFDQSTEFFEPTSTVESVPNAGFNLYLPFSFK